MTEISINGMIVKVNQLTLYDKLVETLVNVTDFSNSGRALLTRVIILHDQRKKCHVKCTKTVTCFPPTTGHCV